MWCWVIDRVRVDEANRFRHDRPARRVIKGARWLLLRNCDSLTSPADIQITQHAGPAGLSCETEPRSTPLRRNPTAVCSAPPCARARGVEFQVANREGASRYNTDRTPQSGPRGSSTSREAQVFPARVSS